MTKLFFFQAEESTVKTNAQTCEGEGVTHMEKTETCFNFDRLDRAKPLSQRKPGPKQGPKEEKRARTGSGVMHVRTLEVDPTAITLSHHYVHITRRLSGCSEYRLS